MATGSCHIVKERAFGCIPRDLLCIHHSTATSALFPFNSIAIDRFGNIVNKAAVCTITVDTELDTLVAFARSNQHVSCQHVKASSFLRINHGLPFHYHLRINLLIMLLSPVTGNHLTCFLATPLSSQASEQGHHAQPLPVVMGTKRRTY